MHKLYNDDCLKVLPTLEKSSIDLICTDLPYGVTACDWDCPIDLPSLWSAWDSVLTTNGVVALHADLRLSSKLLQTTPKTFKFRYELIWSKVVPSRHLDANRMPLRLHELILIFSRSGKGYGTYNPQKTPGKPYVTKRNGASTTYHDSQRIGTINTGDRHPGSIVECTKSSSTNRYHPTQKPEGLTDWLVLSYSNPEDVVLDCSMGSGTTGVSAVKHGRSFVGIELDHKYYTIAEKRIANTTIIDTNTNEG